MARSKRQSSKQRPRTPMPPPKLVDLAQFASLDDALTKVEPGNRYVEAATDAVMPIPAGMGMNVLSLFWLSVISRVIGLHQAIDRECRKTNPHAVFPLIRAFAETVVVLMYVTDHPKYVGALTVRPSELPKGTPQRRSMQALINHVSRHATQMKDLYRELSESTHFGSTAMWGAHIPDPDEGGMRITWTSSPRWRNDRDGLIACAQTLELAEAAEAGLRLFAQRHIQPLRDQALAEDAR